ncbi:MAG: hypothetical protein COU81_03630 [Candidatus Portnoybacteria bacterium CG10_big_fil_rev_8_21_14_0_10_36_7]|uniref:Adenylate kinase n=1 Tax=Candidatus Portnoybacteria bacterium CG10_big_fil_rev_8_21_14_0_10_36_7 TaxID=1974812 RepID=A0A2M8KD96_9BACT|nr:MAG: hypothetical protein COU81_03630 [Candidatus Portnoybacteria bacterium CG10_big_fil_rev_8_21_14_0_10_36_7]
MTSSKIIFLIGLPGAGKGTQANLLSLHFGLYHFETSNMIREKFNKSLNDPEVAEAKIAYDKGDLISAELLFEWLKEAIDAMELMGGIVFDGSPRTLFEVENLLPFLIDRFGRENILALNIKISEEDTMWRNTHRRICEKCRKPVIYSEENVKLINCPHCGGKLVTRDLDKAEIIKERIREYIEETAPVVEYLKKVELLDEVNGQQSVEKVFNDARESILKHFGHGNIKK